MVVNLLIWSKDRACQLDLLLRSMEKHARGLFRPTVIYTYSSGFYKAGYSKLQKEDYDITWIYENNLQHQTRDYINSAEGHICFSTDDQVFHSKVCKCLLDHLPKADNEVFSLRLGLNTLVQDCHAGTYQKPLYNFVQENDKIISWNSNEYHPFDNYGYPLALDTHIFTAHKVQELISYFDFKSTNELESKMQQYTQTINRISSFKNSVSVNIPMNNMSSVTRSGEKHPFDLQFLNAQYLEGKQIDLEDIEQVKWLGCHSEHNLRLK